MEHEEKECIRQYARAIMHMRQQIDLQRFGLVFGSGISQDFGFPGWKELIERIAEDKRVSGSHLLKKAGKKTSVSQLLYQQYKSKKLASLPPDFNTYNKLHSHLQSGWSKIVHDALYKKVPADVEDLKKCDTYLSEYLKIIKNTNLTVNYNFDDTLETLLSESRTPERREEERGFRTVWKADVQLYPDNAVIYHPNGYLPREFREKPSDDLIFLEAAFGDQLIDSVSGHYTALSYHFSQNTCLFIGLSLEDPTLQHLLRKNALLHPGHVHYYVHFLRDDEKPECDLRSAIRDANFEVYNLVTLFLKRSEIAALGGLISVSTEMIERFANTAGVHTTYLYYLTGSVSVGKSTAVSNFRSLRTHDEWLDVRVPGMEKEPNEVEDDSVIQKIDEWVVRQWHAKNLILFRAKVPGIDIVDRCALDAFAFTPKDEWPAKAKFTREIITPDHSDVRLAKGTVILLIGDPKVMEVRAIKSHKKFKEKFLEGHQGLLQAVYDPSLEGIVELDTRDKSIQQVAKEICRIIHIDEYKACDLQNRLEGIEAGDVLPKVDTSKTVVLISCSSQKHNTKRRAGDLYKSPLFKFSLEYAQNLNPHCIYILSAKHGVLSLDDEVEPYDMTLNGMSIVQKKAWAKKVINQLDTYLDLEKNHFVILAGQEYRKFLLPDIKSYEIPLDGLTRGEQLQFLKRQLSNE